MRWMVVEPRKLLPSRQTSWGNWDVLLEGDAATLHLTGNLVSMVTMTTRCSLASKEHVRAVWRSVSQQLAELRTVNLTSGIKN